MKTQDAAYSALRDERFTRPRQFLRLTNPAVYGSATEFPFSVDFASADDIGGSTKTKRPWIMGIGGNTAIVEPEFGRSDAGRFTLQLLDRSGEMVKYFANPPLTLNGAHNNSVTTITVNEDTTGYPALGTIEVVTGGVRERIRYLDKTLKTFIGCTRGVDGTSAASHSNADPVSNGEQIRRGTRAQLYLGYAELDETRFMSFAKMEVVGRAAGKDRVSVVLTIADINRRPTRATVFLTATQEVPRVLAGNPIDLALAMLLSTGGYAAQTGTIAKTAGSAAIVGTTTTFTSYTAGDILRLDDGELLRISSVTDNTHLTAAQNVILTGAGLAFRKGGTNGNYDVLDAVDALGIPPAFVDVTTFEALRSSDFSTDQYEFSVIQPHNGKQFLEQQFMQTLNCYPVVNQTGQLSITRYRVAVGSPTVTLDRDVIRAYDWLPADDQIINAVQFRYDFNVEGAGGQYGTFVEYLAGASSDFTSSIGQFGRTQPVVIEAMGWRTTLNASAMAAARAEQMTDRFAFPQTVLMLDCHYLTHHLEVGDQVYVNDPRIPNVRTGQKGIANEVFEVLDVMVSFRPYFVRFTLLWVAAIPTVAAPSSQGTVSTGNPYLTGPVGDADLDRDLGVSVGGFVYYHKGVFTGSSPRQSWREASLEFAHVQTSGERLEYEQYWEGTDSTKTVGGVDLAAIERGPENAQSATSTTLVLNAGASAVDDAYLDMYLEILSNGTPAANGQIRLVTDYVGSTKTATVATWTTTPTGTISYRVIRTGARDFGNDQNGVSAKPSGSVGSAGLGQWLRRIAALPAAWDGKTIIGMATAMDGAPASSTQVMLVRNPRITSSAGVLTFQLTGYGLTNQGVWGFGSEANVTATTRRESLSASAPTEQLMHLAASRVAIYSDQTDYAQTTTTETVKATMSNLVFCASKDDAVLIDWSATVTSSAGGAQTNNAVFRVRENDASGTILFELTLPATPGAAGKGTTAAGNAIANWRDFQVWRPGSAGFKTLVITAKVSVNADSQSANWDRFKIRVNSKSV